MSVQVVADRLNSYQPRNRQEAESALKEITQELALAGLSRAGFFKAAAFQGGTCLRILYGLDRFSEDLDFILQAPDPAFTLEPYLRRVAIELEAYGYRLDIDDRSQAGRSVQAAFLKEHSLGKLLRLRHDVFEGGRRKLKVKIEVDTAPPSGSVWDQKTLDFPFPIAVTSQDLPSLFAGKLHALLAQTYPKGRDWFDFLWYTARPVSPNLTLLQSALQQAGPWENENVRVTHGWLVSALSERVQTLDWTALRSDIERFLRPNQLPSLDLWNAEFFLERVRRLAKEQ